MSYGEHINPLKKIGTGSLLLFLELIDYGTEFVSVLIPRCYADKAGVVFQDNIENLFAGC